MKLDRILEYITSRKNPVTRDQIAHHFCISQTHATGYLCRLVARGRVIRLAPKIYKAAPERQVPNED
jgi:predicted ArsR family transcriptional regulator